MYLLPDREVIGYRPQKSIPIMFFKSVSSMTKAPHLCRLDRPRVDGLLVLRTLLDIKRRCPFAVSIFLLQWRWIRASVSPGNVVKYPFLTACFHSLIGGQRQVWWKKLINALMDWTSYALNPWCIGDVSCLVSTLWTVSLVTLRTDASVVGRGSMYNRDVGWRYPSRTISPDGL